MTSSVSGQLTMNQIAHCDWLHERAKWRYLARSGLPAVSCEKNFHESQIINPLLAKLFRSRWLDIGLVLFGDFMDLDSVSVHKRAQKELGQYPATLTEQAWSITYIGRQASVPVGLRTKTIFFTDQTMFGGVLA